MAMISVIGAGPAGSFTAYNLAKKGMDVEIFEEHSVVGDPVQCTGILTGDFEGLIQVKKEFLMNKIDKVKVYSPNETVDFKLNKPNFVLSRNGFDRYVAEMAVDAGAKLHLNSRFLGCMEGKKIKIKLKDRIVETDYLVGADGPHSKVANSTGIYGNRKFTLAFQANVKGDYDRKQVDFFIDEGWFGWVVPENEEVARIGVTSYVKTRDHFDNLMKRTGGKKLSMLSGPIPVYNPRLKTQKNNVYLVGDAATQVKTSTHGGIIPGMIAARELSVAITENKSYEKLWKGKIGKDLWIHLMIRKLMDKFKARDCDKLVKLMKQEKLKNIIEEFDREFPSKYAAKMMLKEPRLLSFALKYFS